MSGLTETQEDRRWLCMRRGVIRDVFAYDRKNSHITVTRCESLNLSHVANL